MWSQVKSCKVMQIHSTNHMGTLTVVTHAATTTTCMRTVNQNTIFTDYVVCQWRWIWLQTGCSRGRWTANYMQHDSAGLIRHQRAMAASRHSSQVVMQSAHDSSWAPTYAPVSIILRIGQRPLGDVCIYHIEITYERVYNIFLCTYIFTIYRLHMCMQWCICIIHLYVHLRHIDHIHMCACI